MIHSKKIIQGLKQTLALALFISLFSVMYTRTALAALACTGGLGGCITTVMNFATGTLRLSSISITSFISIISLFLSSLLISLATLAITFGGIMYMLSGGNEQRSARAKNIILFAILGLMVGLAAGAIVLVIQKLYSGDAATAGGNVKTYIQDFISAAGFFLISLAVLAATFGGIMYMLSGGDERKSATAKNIVIYAIIGLVIASLAQSIAQEVKTVVTGGAPASTKALITNISNFLVGFIAVLSTLAIIFGGIMYIITLGDEQRSARAKKIILFAIVGLLISALAPIISNIVRMIITPLLPAGDPLSLPGGASGAAGIVILLIGSIGTFVLSPLAMIATAAIIYGGYMYITSAGEEDKARRGKQIILFTLLGVFIILIAALIVNMIVIL